MTIRKGLGVVAIIGSAAIAAAGASAHGMSATVKIAHTSKGALLVGSNGHTLYVFGRDSRNHDACVKISGCTSLWPPLTTTAKPVAGAGVRRAWLGTISIGGGRKQVTYDGWPLYYYSGDSGPAGTTYLGINVSGGVWYGFTAAGKRVA
jgi:predicted lipoprotein with Yx(FWY)xxD motif